MALTVIVLGLALLLAYMVRTVAQAGKLARAAAPKPAVFLKRYGPIVEVEWRAALSRYLDEPSADNWHNLEDAQQAHELGSVKA